MNVLIVTGGKAPSKELLHLYKEKSHKIIGVDKGCDTLYKNNIKPDIIMGDFDSVSKEVLKNYTEEGIEVEKFNADKDYSDTHLGYKKALEYEDVEDIYILGGTGSRIDHMLGNIGLLRDSLNENVRVYLIDDNNKMWITDKNETIKKEDRKVLSFHALSDVVKSFSIYNAKYSLLDYNLKALEPRAICNEFLEDDVKITFTEGKLLIIIAND